MARAQVRGQNGAQALAAAALKVSLHIKNLQLSGPNTMNRFRACLSYEAQVMVLNSHNKMYEVVRTAKQQKDFESTWEYFCVKNRWYNDPYAKNGIRYNLVVPGRHFFSKKKVIGTVEFIPYEPNNPHSTVEGRNGLGFYRLDEIKQHQHRTWEIDKLCIQEDYQGKGYHHIFMHIFLEHADQFNPKFLLALTESRFYRMLRIVYGLDVVQKGNVLQGPDTKLIPMMFDMENNKEKIKALIRNGNLWRLYD